MALPSLLDPNSSPSVLPPAMGGLPTLSSAPPPPPDSSTMPSAIPKLPSSGLQPLVTNPRMEQEQQLQQSLLPKPGQPGFWHQLGRVASKIGNIAGDVLAPNITALIPGSDLNRVLQHNYNQGQLNSLQEQDQEEQDNASKRNLEGAETANAENGKITPLATDQGYVGFNGSTGEVTPLNDQSGQQLQPKDKQQPQNVHVLPDGKVISISTDKDGKPQAQVVYQGDPAVKTEVKQLEVNGKPHQVLVNSQTGEQIKDLGETGEKPTTVNVNAGTTALDREVKQFGGAHQKGVDTATAQLEKIEDARNMINGNAEAQGLGIPKVLTALVGGQGTGVRITQAELQSIAHARGLQGDFEGTLNKWEGKGALSRQQQQQLTQILDDVRQRIIQKQAIHAGALDAINGASTREQIIAADKDARDKITALENGSGQQQGGKTFSLSAARSLPFNKGKSDDEIRSDLVKHGYTVSQ